MNFGKILAVVFAMSTVQAFAQSPPAELRLSDLQAQAQTKVEEKAKETEDIATIETRYLPANTIVNVTPQAEISSKRVEEGQRVRFVVVDDVVQDDVVVIPRGASVLAKIPWKTGRAIGGKSGKFEVSFESVNLNGKAYAMTGQYRQEGRGNTTGALLGTIFISGRSAVMLPGQIVNAFTNEPIPYNLPKGK